MDKTFVTGYNALFGDTTKAIIFDTGHHAWFSGGTTMKNDVDLAFKDYAAA
jgi:hypothetical protein